MTTVAPPPAFPQSHPTSVIPGYATSGEFCSKYFRFCSEHARKALISRQKISSNSSPPDLTQKCLQSLVQYKQEEIKSEFGNHGKIMLQKF